MRINRWFFIFTFFFILKAFSGCAPAIDIPKDVSSEKNTLFLVHNETVDPIGVVAVFLSELRLMGYEARELGTPSARNGNEEKNRGFYASGFFISENGLFITAYHVIEQAETIFLRKPNGVLYRASVLIEDPMEDIAILCAMGDQKEACWLSLGDYHDSHTGDSIKVLGYPVPNLVGTRPDFSYGVVFSGSGIKGDPAMFEFIAPLSAGYSGAPILNNKNEVIGITSEQANSEWFLSSRTGPLPPDINFGVKINCAKTLLETYLEHVPRHPSGCGSLQDRINSTALVLINTQQVPAGIQSGPWQKIILVQFSRLYFYYIIHYTIFESSKKWRDDMPGKVSASGYIGGRTDSSPSEIFDAFIKEIRTKSMP